MRKYIVVSGNVNLWFHLKDFAAHLNFATNQDSRQFPKLGMELQCILANSTSNSNSKYVIVQNNTNINQVVLAGLNLALSNPILLIDPADRSS